MTRSLLLTLAVLAACQAFQPVSRSVTSTRHLQPLPTLLFSEPEESSRSSDVNVAPPEEPKAVVVPEEEAKTEEVPIDLPSPVLLASSIIIAIVATGSLFSLASQTSELDFGLAAFSALIGVPLAGFLFYAAIIKGQKETQEDDEKFRQSGGF